MENKTTTELIDLLSKLSEDKDDYKSGGSYQQIMDVLREREPFTELLNEEWDESLPSAWEAIKDLQDEIKKLKRHKHDSKTGNVLIRI